MKKFVLPLVFLMLIVMFVSSVSALPTPVAQWSFEEGAGTTVADTYGNYNGTINNSAGTVTWTSGAIGGGIDFNNPASLGDYVRIDESAGSDLEPTGDFAVEAWIKPGVISDRFFVVKSRDWSNVYDNGYQIRTDGLGQKLMFYAGGVTSFTQGAIINDLQSDQWYHIVGVRDGLDNVLYVNGVEAARVTSTLPTNYPGSINPLLIGGLDSSTGWTMDGTIDQVAIYNDKLNPDDVNLLYAQHLTGNEMSVEFFYNALTDTLHTQGFAPANAHSAKIIFENGASTEMHTSCVLITEGETPEFLYDFAPITNTWSRDTFNLRAELYDDASCSGSLVNTAVGGEFNALRVMWIEDQLDQLNQTIQDLNGTFQDNLTAIWTEIDANAADIDAIEADITNLWDAIANLESDVDVQWRYSASNDKLFMQGYAPEGAVSVSYRWNRIDGSGPAIWPPYCSAVNQGNNPEFHKIVNPQADGWDNASYYLYTFFFDGAGCTGTEISPRAYGEEFNYLEVLNIYNELQSLEEALNNTNATLQAQIDDLYNITYDINTNLTAVWDEIDTIWDVVNAMNHGTINLLHHLDNSSDYLEVWGEAPVGSTTAYLRISDVAGNLVYSDNFGVTTIYNNENMYAFTAFTGNEVNLSDWEPLKYNVVVYFFAPQDANMVSALFDDLYIVWLGEWLGDTEDWLIEVEGRLNDTNATATNNTQWLLDVEDNLTAIDAELELVQANITDLYVIAADLQAQIDVLRGRVDVLETQVATLFDMVYAMNHGTLSLVYDENDMELRTHGEAPLGATQAQIMIYDRNNEVKYYQHTVNVNSQDQYSYWWDISDWPQEVLNVKVKFLDENGTKIDRYVQEIFTAWYLYHVDGTLYGDPLACEELGLGPDFYGMLDSYGVPREDTLWYLIEMLGGYEPDMSYGEVCDMSEYLLAYIAGSYGGIDIDDFVDELPIGFAEDIHTILRCLGYDDELHLASIVNMCQQGDIDALEQFTHGFNFVESRTFETFMQDEEFRRNFAFGLNPKYDEDYAIYLVQGWTDTPGGYDISRQLTGCSWTQKDQWNSFLRPLVLPPTWPAASEGEGKYRVWLEARPCTGDPVVPYYRSNRFVIQLDDLADPWPTATVETVSISINEEAYAGGTYWTADPMASISAMLGDNVTWMNDLRCEVYNYVAAGQSRFYGRWDLFNEGNGTMCSGDVDLSTMDPTVEATSPMYDVEICAHPMNAQVECDNVTFGWDTTPPSVDFIYPGELDELSGTVTFRVDVSDDTGFVSWVNISLVNKSDASMTYLDDFVATYNETTGQWELVVDTTQVPDGWYNITVYAYDFAGNVMFGQLDPLIDNTAPVVQYASMSGYYGTGWTVESGITDNLAGVTEAEAEIWAYTCPMYEEQTCTLEWCEEYEELVCEPFMDVDNECYSGCMSGNESNSTICEQECTREFADCNEYCGDDSSCYSYCTEEYCSYEMMQDCGNTAECHDWYIDSECVDFYEGFCNESWEDEGFDNETECVDAYTQTQCVGHYEDGVDTCLENVAETCDGWQNIDGYGSYEECYDDMSRPCYTMFCDYEDDKDYVQLEYSCVDNCFAAMDCDYRAYADGAVETVPLELTTGTSWNGVWTGTLEGMDLPEGMHYEIRVNAWDGAGNQNDEENYYSNTGSLFGMTGYTVSIGVSNSNPTEYETFSASGSVMSSDGSNIPEGYVFKVLGNPTPLLINSYSTQLGPLGTGPWSINAEFWPFEECPDLKFTASTPITVKSGQSSGGGGGGGGSYSGKDTGAKEENSGEGEEPKEDSGEGEELSAGGDTEQLTGGEGESGEKEPETQPEDDGNLITGQATGDAGTGGFAKMWPWLLVVGGLILLLLIIARVVKRR